MADDACRHEVTIDRSPADAFDLFVHRFSAWWPQEFSWAQDALDTMVLEPRAGGHLIERDKSRQETVWGQVLEIAPPDSLVFSWQISPDREPLKSPEQASVVGVRFASDGASRTRVILEHRMFARHGEGWQSYLETMAAQGWPFALARYVAAAE